LPPPPKKKIVKEKRKKKKASSKPKPSVEPERDPEAPPSNTPVEDNPSTTLEVNTTEPLAPRQEKTSSCSHELGDKVKNFPLLRLCLMNVSYYNF
jgi:hypothetical protein